jgi:hypothetical protein
LIAAIDFNPLLMAASARATGRFGDGPGSIALLFILEGALMGAVGALSGVILGTAFNGAFSKVGFDFSSYANMTDYMALISGKIYPTLGLDRAWSRALTVVAVATLAAQIPPRRLRVRGRSAASCLGLQRPQPRSRRAGLQANQ